MKNGLKQDEVHTWDGGVESAIVENTLYVAVTMDDGHVMGMTGYDAMQLRDRLDLVLKEGE
jgi:hypothetical protein